jgi:hypothetical protein
MPTIVRRLEENGACGDAKFVHRFETPQCDAVCVTFLIAAVSFCLSFVAGT